MTVIIFPDSIEWDNEEVWRQYNLVPFPRDSDVSDGTLRLYRLEDLPDGTVVRDRKGEWFGKVGPGGVRSSIVVVNGDDMLCEFDGSTLVAYARAQDEPRTDYALVVVVGARDAAEARTFVKDELNDIHWNQPLEVRHVGEAFEGIPESMTNLETVGITIGGELPAGHEGARSPRGESRPLRRAE